VIRLQNIGDGRFVDAAAYVSFDHFENLRTHEAKAGDLVVASLGEDLPRACLVPDNLGPAIVKADCIRVRLGDHVEPRWVLYAMQTPTVRRWAKDQLHGVGRPRLGLKVIRGIPVPLPPLEEQRRIVDILEDHLSRLDAAQALLQRGQIQLRTLEASALSKAYEASEPNVALADVSNIQGGIQKQPKRQPRNHAYPFLRVANVTKAGLDLSDVHDVELFEGELERLRLVPGDLLVVEGNGSASQIGRAAVWDGSIPNCVHQNHLIRVRPAAEVIPAFLEILWNSPQNRRALSSLASSSSGLHTLSVAKLKSLRFPLPALSVQQKAVYEVNEIRLSIARLTVELSAQNRRAASLRRSLLGAAFAGQLTRSTAVTNKSEELIGV
jgi:type I restriction enzyme S subunit